MFESIHTLTDDQWWAIQVAIFAFTVGVVGIANLIWFAERRRNK